MAFKHVSSPLDRLPPPCICYRNYFHSSTSAYSIYAVVQHTHTYTHTIHTHPSFHTYVCMHGLCILLDISCMHSVVSYTTQYIHTIVYVHYILQYIITPHTHLSPPLLISLFIAPTSVRHRRSLVVRSTVVISYYPGFFPCREEARGGNVYAYMYGNMDIL